MKFSSFLSFPKVVIGNPCSFKNSLFRTQYRHSLENFKAVRQLQNFENQNVIEIFSACRTKKLFKFIVFYSKIFFAHRRLQVVPQKKFLKVLSLLICFFFLFTSVSFCDENLQNKDITADTEDVKIKVIDKENYRLQIKQYDKDYPVVVYVVFKRSTPLLNNINQILKQELISLSKKEGVKNNIIASAWFEPDNDENNELEKIKLTPKYSSYIWVKEKKYVMTFYDYLQFLKKEKKKKILERNKEV